MTIGETRERIVDAAIALFNERGTCAVSTNHIAKAADMSPGNLYYHFRNKEEIVRAAYDRAAAEEDVVWATAGDAGGPEAAQPFLGAVLAVRARYPFLRVEMPELVSRDSELASTYRSIQQQRLQVFRALVESWIAPGGVPPDPVVAERVVAEAWLVLGAWYAHLVANGDPVEDGALMRGAELVVRIVEDARARPGQAKKPKKSKRDKKRKKGKKGKGSKKG